MTREEEKALLLRVVVRVAQTQLEKGEGFIPFGATLGSNRDVQLLMPQGAKGGTMTMEVANAYWGKQMAKAIAAGNVRALCTVGDVRETDGQGRLGPPSVFIHIEHISGDAEDLLYGYAKTPDSAVTFQEPTRDSAALLFFSIA